MIALLLSLAAAADAPPATTLVDCTFRPIVRDARENERTPIPFALMFEAPGPDKPHILSTRVHDPRKMLEGLPVIGGAYTKDGKILFFLTDDRLPIHFRVAFSRGKAGKNWRGAIGMHGAGTARENLERSYMGDCAIGSPADAAARFEALEANR